MWVAPVTPVTGAVASPISELFEMREAPEPHAIRKVAITGFPDSDRVRNPKTIARCRNEFALYRSIMRNYHCLYVFSFVLNDLKWLL
jgi:hypothetical protein